jgi:Zn-dependent M28 family amino/carboxypeptidase
MARRSMPPVAVHAVAIPVLAALAWTGAAADRDAPPARWWTHVTALAGDDMQGRDTGSAGERKAARYVAAQFERAGLGPLADSSRRGYLQPVRLTARRVIESSSRIELLRDSGAPGAIAGPIAEPQLLGEDLVLNAGIDPAPSLDAPLVFVGYGLRIPEANYDDLGAPDVRGAIVVRFAGGPSAIPAPLRARHQTAAEFSRTLAAAGAVGVVTILNPWTPAAWTQVARTRLQESMDLAEPDVTHAGGGLRLALTVNPARAERWLTGSGHTLDELAALAKAGERLPRFPLAPRLRARVHVERRAVASQNVIGWLRGTDAALAREFLVLTAHLDHFGVGESVEGDAIYNGALDNAAGVAVLLDLAETLGRRSARRPRRSVVFAIVTGEEKGMLGSGFFLQHPPIDPGAIVAAINCDMFLPIHPLRLLTAFGMNESSLGDAVRRIARAAHVDVQDDPVPQRGTFLRSDQYSFVRRGIPALMIGIGAAPGSPDAEIQTAWLRDRYHAPSDDLRQPIDAQAAADYTRLLLALVQDIADDDARPRWKADSVFGRVGKLSEQ